MWPMMRPFWSCYVIYRYSGLEGFAHGMFWRGGSAFVVYSYLPVFSMPSPTAYRDASPSPLSFLFPLAPANPLQNSHHQPPLAFADVLDAAVGHPGPLGAVNVDLADFLDRELQRGQRRAVAVVVLEEAPHRRPPRVERRHH